MSERNAGSEEGQRAPKGVELDVEEQLPASLAIKNAIRTALSSLVDPIPRGSNALHMRNYRYGTGQSAWVRNDKHGYEVELFNNVLVAGPGPETETTRRKDVTRYRLDDEREDDIEFSKTSWPDKGPDELPLEVSEAEAKRALALVYRIAESGPPSNRL